MHLDTGLPQQQTTKHQDGRPEHWHTTGVCPQPPPLLSLHPRLLPHPPNQHHSYWEEIQHLTERCSDNNLDVNTSKTKELIVDFLNSKCSELSTCTDFTHSGSSSTLSNKKPPDLLLHGVVLLHSTGQEGPAAGGEGSRASHQDDTTLSDTFILVDFYRRPAVLLRTPLTPDITCSPPALWKEV